MIITSNHLLAIGAWAAMLGGAMRIATAFISYTPETVWLEILYAVIDVLMLIATLAIYIRHMTSLGAIGLLASALACLGFASIIGPDPVMFGIDFYRLGAGVIVISMALLGLQLLRVQALRVASTFWLLALAFALGLTLLQMPVLLVASGVTFGLGFVMAGLEGVRNYPATSAQ